MSKQTTYIVIILAIIVGALILFKVYGKEEEYLPINTCQKCKNDYKDMASAICKSEPPGSKRNRCITKQLNDICGRQCGTI